MLTQTPLCFKGQKLRRLRTILGENRLIRKKARRRRRAPAGVWICQGGLFCLLQEGNHDVAFADIRSDPNPSGDLGFLQHDQLLVFVQPAENL